MRNSGTEVSSIQEAIPGDIICYEKNDKGIGHVAIYMGNNRIVHAANTKAGIKISNNASYRAINTIRRVT